MNNFLKAFPILPPPRHADDEEAAAVDNHAVAAAAGCINIDKVCDDVVGAGTLRIYIGDILNLIGWIQQTCRTIWLN